MAGSNGTSLITHEGTVRSANSKGVKLVEDQDWRNFSKWASTADVFTPAPGARVVLSLDSAGFIRKVEELHPAPIAGGSAPVQPAPAAEPPAAVYVNADAKDLRITRLAVLNTATAILSSGGRAAEAPEVVKLASKLEAWVLR